MPRTSERGGRDGDPTPVRFDGVWKKFQRGEQHDSLRDLIPSLIRSIGRKDDELEEEEFWAVQDVSFAVDAGQALGIIGPNGAGKSTVLKLLTRILRPTRGRCHVRGRVGALIEVAAGFHGDLTGRENIYLQGAIMGMKRPEITAKLDDIIAFAGTESFVDTPVKRYSSGMNARLGFSIAAHLSPDVLIIDEVLSVGDMLFQQRCVDRMKEFKHNGAAIVFVSHNMQAVSDLCERTLHLHRGVRAIGPTAEVMEGYVSEVGAGGDLDGLGDVRIVRAELLDASGATTSVARPCAPLRLRVEVEGVRAVSDLRFGFFVHRSTDRLLAYGINALGEEIGLNFMAPGQRAIIEFAFEANLARGQYHLEATVVHTSRQAVLARLSPAAMLGIGEQITSGGIANLAARASVQHGSHASDAARTSGEHALPRRSDGSPALRVS